MTGFKRILCLALSLVMLLAILGGCGGNGEPKDTAAAETKAPDGTTPPVTEPADTPAPEAVYPYPLEYIPVEESVEVTLWCSFNPQALTMVDGVEETAAFVELESRTGVVLESTSVAGNVARDAFNIMINAGDYPDIIGNLATFYSSLDGAVEDEVAIDLKPYLAEYCPNFWYLINQNPEIIKHLTSEEGRIVRYTSFSMEPSISTLGTVIRQDWLDELSMDTPTTYDELYDTLTAFKTELGAESPLFVNYMGIGFYNTLSNGYGISACYDMMQSYYPFSVADNGEVFFSWTDDNMKDFLVMMNQWYNEGLVWKDFSSDAALNSIASSKAYSEALSDNVGVFHSEIALIKSMPQQHEAGTMVLSGIADFTKNKGDTLHNEAISIGVGQSSWSISTQCDEDKIPIICNWIDYCFTEEGSELGSWGIEGISWEYDGNGNHQFTDLILDNQDGLSNTVLLALYCMQSTNPYLLSMDREKALYTEQQLEANDIWQSNQDGANAYPVSAKMTTQESMEFSSLWADISTYGCEQIPKFVIGELNLDADWDTFVAAMEAMDCSHLVELKQAAYERYLLK